MFYLRWVRRWLIRCLLFWRNTNINHRQLKDVSPVWERRWLFRIPFWENHVTRVRRLTCVRFFTSVPFHVSNFHFETIIIHTRPAWMHISWKFHFGQNASFRQGHQCEPADTLSHCILQENSIHRNDIGRASLQDNCGALFILVKTQSKHNTYEWLLSNVRA